MPEIVQTLFKRRTILIAFLAATALQGLYFGLTINSNEVWGTGILSVLVYAVIAWFANQRQPISVWAICMIMIYEGVGGLSLAMNTLTASPVTSFVAAVVSGYVILGALALFLTRYRSE